MQQQQQANNCQVCGATYADGEYQCPIRTRRLAFGIIKFAPRKSQNNHGPTHHGDLSHAIDYDVRVGTNVYAARDGLVIDLVRQFKTGGTTQEWRSRANYVCLLHEDQQTFSRYFHLSQVCVELGQRVHRGQRIAKSGNTGFTFGPHLHFDLVDLSPKHVCELRILLGPTREEETLVDCVPFNFSKFPFPPAATSQDDQPAICAKVCLRGGSGGNKGQSFRELVERERNYACVLIIDNDVEMGSALPLLVGDSGPRIDSTFALLIANSNLQKHGLEPGMEVQVKLRTSAYYYHPHDRSQQQQLRNRPRTLPVHIKDFSS